MTHKDKIIENKDPVCGMTVDPSRAVYTIEYNGETIYFCSDSCKGRFEAEPDRYLNNDEDDE